MQDVNAAGLSDWDAPQNTSSAPTSNSDDVSVCDGYSTKSSQRACDQWSNAMPGRPKKMAATETRKAFKARVQAEGRWDEAIRFREAARSRLGTEHPEWDYKRISREAWSMMFETFPPARSKSAPPSGRRESPAVDAAARSNELPAGNAQAEQIARSKLLEAALGLSERGGVQEDTEWVYQNLDVPWDGIEVASVPSPGGVALLKQAKKDRKWFLQTYHAKLLPMKSKFESEGWFEADDSRIREMADEVREELARRCRAG